MPTVIVGAGIIGVSTAYYLAKSAVPDAQDIHLVEACPTLFESASGFAAGFLAKDWFSPALANLGELSFKLHKDLAEVEDGHHRWGYNQSTGTSLAESNVQGGGGSGADWLREGASRAVAAENTQPGSGNAPSWLQSKGDLDVLSNGETTAQINPLNLCEFLISECLAMGVKLHQPCRPISIAHSDEGSLLEIENSVTQEHSSLQYTALLIAAGAWSSIVTSTLFPTAPSTTRNEITALAGHALVLRSPHWPPPALDPTDTTSAKSDCHAVFTTEAEGGYSPEIFSRMPNGEVYLAGLNSSTYPLPKVANERVIDPAAIAVLKKTARRLCGQDVEIMRESVCWRPVTRKGTPIIRELSDVSKSGGSKVFLAAGHGAWGISLSMGTGYCVAGMVQGKDMSEFVGRL